jgi:hypothetical protein
MLPNPGFDTLLRREINSLPLPPPTEWIPAMGGSHPASTAAWALGGIALIAAAVIGGTAVREWRMSGGTAADSGADATRGPLSSPRIIDRPRVLQLPIAVRHPELGFNIVLPANWREDDSRAPSGSSSILGRVTFTARSAEQQAELLDRYARSQAPGRPIELPWDVSVTLWSDDGTGVEQFARTRGCASACTLTTAVINGTMFVTTVTDALTQRHAFYVQRPHGLLEFSYIIGGAADQPTGVTPETLGGIVHSVGLP